VQATLAAIDTEPSADAVDLIRETTGQASIRAAPKSGSATHGFFNRPLALESWKAMGESPEICFAWNREGAEDAKKDANIRKSGSAPKG